MEKDRSNFLNPVLFALVVVVRFTKWHEVILGSNLFANGIACRRLPLISVLSIERWPALV